MLRRFQQVAAWLTGDPGATIDEGVGWLVKLAKVENSWPARYGHHKSGFFSNH